MLYQRGIYPPDMFSREKKYGMALFVTKNEKLKNYLEPLLKQVEGKLCSEVLIVVV